MNTTACHGIEEQLPDWIGGRLPDEETARVAAHVGGCAQCAAEARVLRVLFGSRPQAPAGLASRISDALRARPEPVTAPSVTGLRQFRRAWGLPAAAVLVLAVGTAVLQRGQDPVGQGIRLGEIEEGVEVWIADDGMVAGALVLAELSDEALAALLEELDG